MPRPSKTQSIKLEYSEKAFHQESLDNALMLESIKEVLSVEQRAWIDDALGNMNEKAYRRGYQQGYVTASNQSSETQSKVMSRISEWRYDLNPAISHSAPGTSNFPPMSATDRMHTEARSGSACLEYLPTRYIAALRQNDHELSSDYHQRCLEFYDE